VKIDLPENIIKIIAEVAEKFPEIERITVFGSRVLGNAKPGSDVDLAIMGKAVTAKVISSLHDYLEEETNIPYFFDIIHFDSIENEGLREHINYHGKTLYFKTFNNEDVSSL
jgi:predicted nucleotidyltransferase